MRLGRCVLYFLLAEPFVHVKITSACSNTRIDALLGEDEEGDDFGNCKNCALDGEANATSFQARTWEFARLSNTGELNPSTIHAFPKTKKLLRCLDTGYEWKQTIPMVGISIFAGLVFDGMNLDGLSVSAQAYRGNEYSSDEEVVDRYPAIPHVCVL